MEGLKDGAKYCFLFLFFVKVYAGIGEGCAVSRWGRIFFVVSIFRVVLKYLLKNGIVKRNYVF